MCVICYAPKGVSIPAECIKKMFDANPDGAGIMWRYKNKVHTRKGFFSSDSLQKAIANIPVGAEKAIHCRIATSGLINKNNCHPFTFPCGALMHNGVLLDFTPDKASKVSDTYLFSKKFITPLAKFLDNVSVQKSIEKISTGSKLLIFRDTQKTLFFGDWVTVPEYKQLTFSNDYFMYDNFYSQYFDTSDTEYHSIMLENDYYTGNVDKNAVQQWCNKHNLVVSSFYPADKYTTYVDILGRFPQSVEEIAGYVVLDVY